MAGKNGSSEKTLRPLSQEVAYRKWRWVLQSPETQAQNIWCPFWFSSRACWLMQLAVGGQQARQHGVTARAEGPAQRLSHGGLQQAPPRGKTRNQATGQTMWQAPITPQKQNLAIGYVTRDLNQNTPEIPSPNPPTPGLEELSQEKQGQVRPNQVLREVFGGRDKTTNKEASLISKSNP